MDLLYNDYLISDSKELIQINRVYEMISSTYWANKRPLNIIITAIENSLCFGVYIDENQVGFARCVTDYATFYWLCDVVIDDKYRNLGLGKKLIEFVTEHKDLKPLQGILGTKDAHGFYEKYGFKRKELMLRQPNVN